METDSCAINTATQMPPIKDAPFQDLNVVDVPSATTMESSREDTEAFVQFWSLLNEVCPYIAVFLVLDVQTDENFKDIVNAYSKLT